jgi:ATP-dependent RNA helicase DBP3
MITGKTLAFALPALSAMAREDRSGARRSNSNSRRLPRMLVLSPTRELAMQSDVVLQEFGKVVQLSSLVIYGGVPKFTQTNELKRGNVDCIVATPGRLKDLIQQGSCDLSEISQLVLDEADRM